jgi:uncharacterized membrane protein
MSRFFRPLATITFTLLAAVSFAHPAQALRSNPTDWYIDDFKSDIIVNTDSSLTITEYITADCGTLPNKHGIFRIVPTGSYLTKDTFHQTPIYLTSITDFQGVPYKYSQNLSSSDHTITWKIGDPNRNVSGVHYYKIVYRVENAILQSNPSFDELYWNLNGNFWDIETDHYQATITFPAGIDSTTAEVNLYSGYFRTSGNQMANYAWDSQNRLVVTSTRTLATGEGITVSVTTPKNIFSAYTLTSQDKEQHTLEIKTSVTDRQISTVAGILFPIFIPIFTFLLLYTLWRKYGRDPQYNLKTFAPEFDIPDHLAPIEMDFIYRNGVLSKNAVSAAIINLAVKGYLQLEQTQEKTLFKEQVIQFTRLKDDTSGLPLSESMLLERLFAGRSTVNTKDLQFKFYKDVIAIQKTVTDQLVAQNLLDVHGRAIQGLGSVLLAFFFFGWAKLLAVLSPISLIGYFLSFVIAIVFLAIMPRRTEAGLPVYRRIQGYKLFLTTAEKYRAQYMEKENIFERFLPYAILFGITGMWLKAFKNIYGEEYASAYTPIWLVGFPINGSFAALDSTITSISNNISTSMASTPSSSGSGGGGSSGGGGGGGGGGGW